MTKTDKTVQCIDNTGAKGEYHLLDKGEWREIRKIQGETKGKPYIVPKTGIIRLPSMCIGKELRVYVEVV